MGVVKIPEIMRRISELDALRKLLSDGKTDPEVLAAALDFIDNSIAVHESDLVALMKAG